MSSTQGCQEIMSFIDDYVKKQGISVVKTKSMVHLVELQ